ncbi:hypothetical protein BS50DRAFT_351729 [Corynespora cassiicola Philippines]|uniref:Uncharacterized protein n=1 Tax=Corynespora cassiicola Philippines TaxID=1448308 RepID=A0A2T2NR77_CORCC|nr:hypothetical protein BS50DRAFT_351729 [Corynespora cassiicola Philippines]
MYMEPAWLHHGAHQEQQQFIDCPMRGIEWDSHRTQRLRNCGARSDHRWTLASETPKKKCFQGQVVPCMHVRTGTCSLTPPAHPTSWLDMWHVESIKPFTIEYPFLCLYRECAFASFDNITVTNTLVHRHLSMFPRDPVQCQFTTQPPPDFPYDTCFPPALSSLLVI